MLRFSRKKGIVSLASENLPFKDATFDTVSCFLTVLNMCNAQKAAKEFLRVLKPQGHVLLSLASMHDNGGKPAKRISLDKHKMTIRLFTKKELENLFAGCELLSFDSLFRTAPPKWGTFAGLTQKEKEQLERENDIPPEKGALYFLAFRKP